MVWQDDFNSRQSASTAPRRHHLDGIILVESACEIAAAGLRLSRLFVEILFSLRKIEAAWIKRFEVLTVLQIAFSEAQQDDYDRDDFLHYPSPRLGQPDRSAHRDPAK